MPRISKVNQNFRAPSLNNPKLRVPRLKVNLLSTGTNVVNQSNFKNLHLSNQNIFSSIRSITSKMLFSLEPKEVIGSILQAVKDLGFDRAYIYEADFKDEKPHLKIVGAINPDDIKFSRYIEAKEVLPDDPGKYKVLTSLTPKIYYETKNDIKQNQKNLRPGLIIPLVVKNGENKIVGLLKVDNGDKELLKDIIQEDILMIFANLAGEALRLAKLHKELAQAEKEKFSRIVVDVVSHFLNNTIAQFDLWAQLSVKSSLSLKEEIIKKINSGASSQDLKNWAEKIGGMADRAKSMFETVEVLKKMFRQINAYREKIDLNLKLPVSSIVSRTLLLFCSDPVVKKLGENFYPDLKLDSGDTNLPEAIGKVVYEILMNSAEAVQRKGVPADIKVIGKRNDNEYEIIISDNGDGIPSDKLKVLKQANVFNHIGSNASRNFGLGFPIAKKIVEELGGKIDVLNTSQNGTSIVIKIPL